MNKLLKVFGAFVVAIGVFAMAKVNAAEQGSLTISADKTTLSKGETFTVSITAASELGINGLSGRIEYNTNALEYVNKSFAIDTDKCRDFGTFPEIAIIANEAGIKKITICTMQFKVKENTTLSSATITLTKSEETGKLLLSLSGDGSNDVEFADKVLNLTISSGSQTDPEDPGNPSDPVTKTLTKIQITKQPTKTSYKIGETFDPSGMKVVAVYSDGTQQEVTNYTYSPSGQLTVNDKKIIITYREGNIQKTAEVNISVSETGSDPSEGNLPLTGIEDTGIYFILPIIMLATSFIGLRRYRGI